MSHCSGPVFGSVRSVSRRDFLRRAGGGFGLVALASLLNRDGLLAADTVAEKPLAHPNPLAPRPPHYTPRARAVIFLFMSGGPSHVDLFDPKPDLIRLAGQPIPESFGAFKTRRNVARNNLLPPLRPFRKHGQSGIEVSDLLPHLAGHVDAMRLESHREELGHHYRGPAADLQQPAFRGAEEVDGDALLRNKGDLALALAQVLERERIEQRFHLRLGGKRGSPFMCACVFHAWRIAGYGP